MGQARRIRLRKFHRQRYVTADAVLRSVRSAGSRRRHHHYHHHRPSTSPRKMCRETFAKGRNNNATRVVQRDIKLTPAIKGRRRRQHGRTRNSNKLLAIGACCTQVLRRRVPPWNGDRASDGLLCTQPPKLQRVYAGPGLATCGLSEG